MLMVNDKFRLESNTKTEQLLEQYCFNFSRLIGIYGVPLKETVKSSTKLQKYKIRTGLACNIHGFCQLLKHHYFEVLVDHRAIENLQNGKKEIVTKQTFSTTIEIK